MVYLHERKVLYHNTNAKEKFTMAKTIKKLVLLLLLTQVTSHCQMKKELPEFHVEISEPSEKYEVTPVFDKIKTLEGVPASLPYGSTSGEWASSGKSFTAQNGTPIGFEFTYYSRYEDKYYYINQDFDKEYMQEMTNRCYANDDQYNRNGYLKEFVEKKDAKGDTDDIGYPYECFSTLTFGFAPQGMIVVWLQYSQVSIELGRFQAKEITDKQKIKEAKNMYTEKYRIDSKRYEEARKEMHIPNANCQLWDNYRLRYHWSYKVTSANKNFRFLGLDLEYFNGEYEKHFMPRILNEPVQSRAVPEVIHFFWETANNERFISRIFFNWDKANKWLKESGVKDNVFNIKVNEDNSQVTIDLNGQKIEVDSIRIYRDSHLRFKDSYPE